MQKGTCRDGRIRPSGRPALPGRRAVTSTRDATHSKHTQLKPYREAIRPIANPPSAGLPEKEKAAAKSGWLLPCLGGVCCSELPGLARGHPTLRVRNGPQTAEAAVATWLRQGPTAFSSASSFRLRLLLRLHPSNQEFFRCILL